jgi:hypothetical protein
MECRGLRQLLKFPTTNFEGNCGAGRNAWLADFGGVCGFEAILVDLQ